MNDKDFEKKIREELSEKNKILGNKFIDFLNEGLDSKEYTREIANITLLSLTAIILEENFEKKIQHVILNDFFTGLIDEYVVNEMKERKAR